MEIVLNPILNKIHIIESSKMKRCLYGMYRSISIQNYLNNHFE